MYGVVQRSIENPLFYMVTVSKTYIDNNLIMCFWEASPRTACFVMKRIFMTRDAEFKKAVSNLLFIIFMLGAWQNIICGTWKIYMCLMRTWLRILVCLSL